MSQVVVPDIGDFKEVAVIEILVKPGDTVAKEQSLVALESDKATMEIRAPAAGTVKELKIKPGDKVSQGSPILVLEGADQRAEPRTESKPEAPKPAPSAPSAVPAASAGTRPIAREPREETASKPHASPSVRKFARELGVDLTQVQGSGPKGRILHSDVQSFVKGALSRSPGPATQKTGGGALPFNLPAWPDVDFAKFGLAHELAEVSKVARDGKLKPGDLQGGTFSISSLGGIGGSYFTPIINAPEVAILGVSRSVMKPVWNGKEFAPRLMLPLSLSYDHRVIDGATAARFTSYLVSVLSDIRKLIL